MAKAMDDPRLQKALASWTVDEYGCWNLHLESAWIYLCPRPPYCDRGHWLAQCQGISTLDSADAFPRYYMDLDRAKAELTEWLLWRLKQDQRKPLKQERP